MHEVRTFCVYTYQFLCGKRAMHGFCAHELLIHLASGFAAKGFLVQCPTPQLSAWAEECKVLGVCSCSQDWIHCIALYPCGFSQRAS